MKTRNSKKLLTLPPVEYLPDDWEDCPVTGVILTWKKRLSHGCFWKIKTLCSLFVKTKIIRPLLHASNVHHTKTAVTGLFMKVESPGTNWDYIRECCQKQVLSSALGAVVMQLFKSSHRSSNSDSDFDLNSASFSQTRLSVILTCLHNWLREGANKRKEKHFYGLSSLKEKTPHFSGPYFVFKSLKA